MSAFHCLTKAGGLPRGVEWLKVYMAHYNNGWDRFQNSLALIFITAKAGRLEEAHAEFDALFAPYQHPPRAIERPKRLLDEAGEEPFPTLAPKPLASLAAIYSRMRNAIKHNPIGRRWTCVDCLNASFDPGDHHKHTARLAVLNGSI